MLDSAASVGTGINRHSGIPSLGDRFMTVSMEVTHMCGIFWELAVGLSGDGREGLDIDQSRDKPDLALSHSGDCLVGKPSAVLNTVNTGINELCGSFLGKTVRSNTGTKLMSTIDGGLGDICGPQRSEIPLVAINPVTDKLDPTITGSSLTIDLGNEIFRIYLSCVVTDVTLRAGDVASGTNDPRKVVAVVDPMGITRRSSIADEKGARLRLGPGLLVGSLRANGTMSIEANVVMGVN